MKMITCQACDQATEIAPERLVQKGEDWMLRCGVDECPNQIWLTNEQVSQALQNRGPDDDALLAEGICPGGPLARRIRAECAVRG